MDSLKSIAKNHYLSTCRPAVCLPNLINRCLVCNLASQCDDAPTFSQSMNLNMCSTAFNFNIVFFVVRPISLPFSRRIIGNRYLGSIVGSNLANAHFRRNFDTRLYTALTDVPSLDKRQSFLKLLHQKMN